jgi:7-cyano-7-deazaguanine synthase
MATLVVCSGGLDSITLAWRVAEASDLAGLVTFDYGQRHRKELDYAARAGERLGVPQEAVDLSGLGRHLTGSALTDDVDVPEGHYAADNMAVTVVPNRNPIMFTIAFGMASSRGWDGVAAAVHGGDHFVYPDCRPDFVAAFADMERRALEGMGEVAFHTPFVHWSKADIVAEGARLGVPFAETWSCYQGGERHCGRCGTCVERREAFHLAGVADPTDYADPDYWAQAVGEKA